MPIVELPPVDEADKSGLLAIGGDTEPESLILAYTSGVFPWPLDEDTLAWFAPPMRAILRIEDFHIPKSLRKERNRQRFTFSFNRAFSEVIQMCSELKNRGEQNGTWITSDIIKGYTALHRIGFCHSIEAWHEDRLVGGLYGVSLGGFFSGESMFFREPNASKLALWHLVDHLRESEVEWIDCQVTTPLIHKLGAVEITRKRYMTLLKMALGKKAPVF